jgi:dTDP-4-dehydrorhamnose reductase
LKKDLAMDILITGGAGMLGKVLIEQLAGKHRTSFTVHTSNHIYAGATAISCDLASPDLSLPNFDMVIHTAAMTDVEYCQANPEEAFKNNVLATRNLVRACPNSYIVYISTDFVFDGASRCYRETDLPNPLSEYGLTKYLGEREIPPSGCILRTSIFGLSGGEGKPTFIEKALEHLSAGEEIYGFSDQWFSPISTYNLAEIIEGIAVKKPSGILHVGGPERLSKHEFMKKLAFVFGYGESLVKANSLKDFNYSAPRPRDSSLDISHARKLLTKEFVSVDKSLASIKQMVNNKAIR